VEVSTTRR